MDGDHAGGFPQGRLPGFGITEGNSLDNALQRASAHSVRTLAGMLSGPVALDEFSRRSSHLTVAGRK